MKLKVKVMNFETGNRKNVIINYSDSLEIGQKAGERIRIKNVKSKSIEDKYWVAILEIDHSNSIVQPGEIGLSLDILKEKRDIKEGTMISVKPANPPESFSYIQKKIKANKLNGEEINKIINDAVSGSLSRIELASFITGVAINGMDHDEMTALTLAEARSGEIFNFGTNVFDKHSTIDYVS